MCLYLIILLPLPQMVVLIFSTFKFILFTIFIFYCNQTNIFHAIFLLCLHWYKFSASRYQVWCSSIYIVAQYIIFISIIVALAMSKTSVGEQERREWVYNLQNIIHFINYCFFTCYNKVIDKYIILALKLILYYYIEFLCQKSVYR